MTPKPLLLQQLDSKLLAYQPLQKATPPPTGWIRAIRTALGMSMQQLGSKLSITKQGVQDIERREREGAITIKALQEVGNALEMQFVYGFIPNHGSLDAWIQLKAQALAKQIVLRTSHTMKLEDQENARERIEQAIQERAIAIKKEMPKILWD